MLTQPTAGRLPQTAARTLRLALNCRTSAKFCAPPALLHARTLAMLQGVLNSASLGERGTTSHFAMPSATAKRWRLRIGSRAHNTATACGTDPSALPLTVIQSTATFPFCKINAREPATRALPPLPRPRLPQCRQLAQPKRQRLPSRRRPQHPRPRWRQLPTALAKKILPTAPALV